MLHSINNQNCMLFIFIDCFFFFFCPCLQQTVSIDPLEQKSFCVEPECRRWYHILGDSDPLSLAALLVLKFPTGVVTKSLWRNGKKLFFFIHRLFFSVSQIETF